MEVSHLYSAASEHGAKALAIMTCTDEIHVPDNFAAGKCEYVRISPEERQTGLDKMLKVAQQICIVVGKKQAAQTQEPDGEDKWQGDDKDQKHSQSRNEN